MPSYEGNAYYNPENHNPPLETVHHFEAYSPDWSFDLFIVVRDKTTGKLYVASDSGCSCPTPFEDHTWPTDFTEIKSWTACKRELDRAFPISDYRARKPHDALRRAVQDALREPWPNPLKEPGATEVSLRFVLDEEVTPHIFATKIAAACKDGALRPGERIELDLSSGGTYILTVTDLEAEIVP